MKNLAVYDFDGTLYKGDTLRKFWMWSFRHKLKPWMFFPHSVLYLIIYCLGLISQDTLKYGVMKFITKKTLKKDLKIFWKTQTPFSWVEKQFASDRKKGYLIVVISASPTFFLEPLTKKLEWDVLIGSPTDLKTMTFPSPNARGAQKVVYLNAWAKKKKISYKIKHMFSDRLVDKPLFDLAEKTYAVPDDGKFYAGLPKK
ncbi:MAG: haloacid dehalogenase-like hydrolase [Alphaproteobacteria bacterium]